MLQYPPEMWVLGRPFSKFDTSFANISTVLAAPPYARLLRGAGKVNTPSGLVPILLLKLRILQ
jgi:hypothetical protein